MLGHRDEAPRKGREWGYLVHPQDLPEALAALRTYLTSATETFEAEYRALHANGQWVWISSRGKVVQSRPNGTPMRMAGNLMDVTARKWSEHRLRLAQAELQATLNALPDLLFEVTVDGLYRAVHARDVSLLTAPPAYVIDRSVHELMPSQAAQVWTQALVDAQKTGRSNGRQYSLDLWGQTFWFELSVVRKPTEREEEPRFVAIARDITERKTVGDAIAHLAFHDTLTRLPNRRLSTERLQRAVTSSSRTGQFGALMFIDLDRFKHLNDTHGHEMGDLLLIEVAQRLRVCVREMDTVASLGGDEFVVLIQDLSDSASPPAEYAQAVGRKILDSLGARYMLKELSYESTPITGATLFAAEGLT
jgi:PAS domain S-box-containing protein